MRVDDVLPERPQWRPIAFGVIVRRLSKVPWSFGADRSADFAEIDARAAARGLPPVRYPDGWPVETYSLTPLRAALLADEAGLLRELTRELFAVAFAEGRSLDDADVVAAAAERVGMDGATVRAGLEREDIKERLRGRTEEAITLGVSGVPTIARGGRLFWGDDRLEDAAAAAA